MASALIYQGYCPARDCRAFTLFAHFIKPAGLRPEILFSFSCLERRFTRFQIIGNAALMAINQR